MNNPFRAFAHRSAELVGSPLAFLAGVLIVLAWGITGPLFHYSDTWQLVINTGTTIITFLMVFLIQNTQNRDSKAMHLKLDELIRAVGAARTDLVHLEDLSDDDLKTLETEFKRLHQSLDRTHGREVPPERPVDADPKSQERESRLNPVRNSSIDNC